MNNVIYFIEIEADTSSAKIQPQVINLLGVFLFLDFSF